jgi:hypothetical protein
VVDLFPFNLAYAAMTIRFLFATGLLLTLGACATPTAQRAATPANKAGAPCVPAVCEFTAVPNVFVAAEAQPSPSSALLGELARIAALTPEQRRRELANFDAERRLEDDRRFQLAALLEREDTNEALERSLKLLGAISGGDEQAQVLVELMKKSLRMRLELRQQNARVQELQDRIEQIKTLEKSLQQRNVPTKTP